MTTYKIKKQQHNHPLLLHKPKHYKIKNTASSNLLRQE